MNKKQIIGLIVAAVAFICVSGSSVLINSYSSNIAKESEESLKAVALSSDVSLPSEEFVGVVKVEGTIQSSSGSDSIFSTPQGYNHKKNFKLY